MPRHAPAASFSRTVAKAYCGRHRRQMNTLKDAIKSGRTVVGTTVTPDVDVSILADAGYDFLLFDTQHAAWDIKQLRARTSRGAGPPEPGLSHLLRPCPRGARFRCADGQPRRGGGGRRARLPLF